MTRWPLLLLLTACAGTVEEIDPGPASTGGSGGDNTPALRALSPLTGELRGRAGEPLADAIAVRVTEGGAPVPGVSVRFTPATDAGSIELGTAVTGDDGVATAGRWTLGTRTGPHALTVEAEGADPITLQAVAGPGAPIHVAAHAGDEQTAPVGTAVDVRPQKRITDTHGNPVPGLAVTFEIVSGGGRVEGADTVTDADGVATVGAWILGDAPGENLLQARMPGLPLTTFRAVGIADGEPYLLVVDGNGQSAPVDTAVPVAPSVRAFDAQGAPWPGVTVSFVVTEGEGRVEGGSVTTDAQGLARAGAWILGPDPGENRVEARLEGAAPVSFSATGTATGTPGLEREVVVSGLQNPWDLAFAPDGTLVLTERSGEIKIVPPGETRARTLHRPADLDAQGQSGMLGLALAPDFAQSRELFVYFSARSGSAVDNRIVRFRVNDDWSGVSSRVDLLTGISWGNGGAHSGGRLRFGPDGLLYATTGDNRSATIPQDPQAMGSKVLRIDRSGAIPAGNMAAPFAPAIWAYGFRNPQGIAFRPGSGDAFLCEHGPGTDDEVTKLVAGGNGGWDPKAPDFPSNSSYWGYNGTLMTDRTKFPDALPPTFIDRNSGGMSGCTFLSGAAWRDWNGALAVGSLGDRVLRVMRLSADGNAVEGEVVTLFGGEQRLRSAVLGPDGSLYLATDGRSGGDEIWRITPQ